MPVAVSGDVVRRWRFEVIPGLGVQPGLVVPEDLGEAVRLLALVQELAEELEEGRGGFGVSGETLSADQIT